MTPTQRATVLATVFLLGTTATAAADAPALIPLQGVLTDASGSPINGTVDIAVTLYDAATDGAVLFTETASVDVDNGAFTLYTGATTALDLALFRDVGTVYAGIKVGADAEMTPRIQLATVPYAAFAQAAGDADTLEGYGATDFASSTHGHAWGDLTDVPTGLADGTDADTLGGLSCVDGDVAVVTSGDWACVSTTNWNAAYGWGNHATAGYLTSETDPDFDASPAAGISAGNITNWNAAYGWGNHAVAGYLTSETDPDFDASPAAGISAGNITNWNAAYGWGNHATAGYLTSETDPDFDASAAAGISAGDITNWNAAYGWGDHAAAGYLQAGSHSISISALTCTPQGNAIHGDNSLCTGAGTARTSGANNFPCAVRGRDVVDTYICQLPLPAGVTIDNVVLYGYDGAADGYFEASIYRQSPTTFGIGYISPTFGGTWQSSGIAAAPTGTSVTVYTSSDAGHVIQAGQRYVLAFGTHAPAGGVMVYGFRVDYTVNP